MEIRVIKNKAQHEEYLAEIRSLIPLDPEPESKEGKRLELLAALVESYEKEHFPIDKPDPIEAIKFRMEQQGLKQKDLIPYMGSPSKVSEVLSGTRQLTLSMIRNLSVKLKIPAEVLLKNSESKPKDTFELDWNNFPISEMIKLGWINATIKEAREKAEELLQNFFFPLSNKGYFPLFCRRTVHARTKHGFDENALIAWAGRVLMRAEEQPPKKEYKPDTITNIFLKELAQLSSDKNGPIAAKEFLYKKGISLIIERHLPGTQLDGASMIAFNKHPVVGLTLRHDRIDNFWFTLFHELGHVSLHLIKDNEIFIDDIDYNYHGDPKEKEADRFAREAFIPRAIWRRSDAYRKRTPAAIKKFAKENRIHPAIVAGRIRYETRDFSILNELIGNREVRRLFPEIIWD